MKNDPIVDMKSVIRTTALIELSEIERHLNNDLCNDNVEHELMCFQHKFGDHIQVDFNVYFHVNYMMP